MENAASAARTPPEAPRRVVITGASGEIGHAVAHAFAQRGASLGLVGGHNRPALERLAREVEGAAARAGVAAPRVALAQVDFRAEPAAVRARVREASAELERALGGVDGLVALAGLPADPALWNKPFPEVTAEDLFAAYAVDTVGTFVFAQALAPALTAARGSIVVMCSSAAFYGDVWGLAYAPAKSANVGLVRMLARLLAPHVRVNGVAPGGIATAWVKSLSPEGLRHAESTPLVGRLGTAEEVARAIVALAAPGYANGQILRLDGGVFPAPPPY